MASSSRSFLLPLKVLVLGILVLSPHAAVAENLAFHGDRPISFALMGESPTTGSSSFIGSQRVIQIQGTPAFMDVSGLAFSFPTDQQQQQQTEEKDGMTIHILLVRKQQQQPAQHDNQHHHWSEGVIDPNYCSNDDSHSTHAADPPSPVLDTQHPRLALHSTVFLPPGTSSSPVTASLQETPILHSGTYVLFFTTCHHVTDTTTTGGSSLSVVYAEGVVRIRSSYGRLPGEQVPMALFVIVVAVYTTLLAGRYTCASIATGKSTTMTERIVQWAVTSMALQAVVLLLYFVLWNQTGDRPTALIYAVLVLEVAKHALTFGVACMMSMGQGYSVTFVAVGVWYLVLLFVIEVLRFVLREYGNTVRHGDLLLNVLSVLNVMYYGTDLLVISLVLCFLVRTMRYLQRANQWTKLRRYRAFLALLLIILLATVVAMFGTKMRFYGEVVFECSFVAILTAMAWLWWPHPENRDYERVMELPQLDPDGNERMENYENDFDDGLDDEFGGVELRTKDQEDMFTESETDFGEDD